MEIQEIKIDGITYIENEDSTACNNCALKDEEDCCILIQEMKSHSVIYSQDMYLK